MTEVQELYQEAVGRLLRVAEEARDSFAEDDEFDHTHILGKLNGALEPFGLMPKWQHEKQLLNYMDTYARFDEADDE